MLVAISRLLSRSVSLPQQPNRHARADTTQARVTRTLLPFSRHSNSQPTQHI